MRKLTHLFLIFITALFLFGFKAGGETVEETLEKKRSKTSHTSVSGPVVEYTETVAPEKTPQELYKQYHLLAVSSLEEALSTFNENKRWTYRMVHNASKYIRLLQGLLRDDKSDKFSGLLDDFEPLLADLKNKNLTAIQQEKYKDKLKRIAATLEQDYTWEKVKQWIAQ